MSDIERLIMPGPLLAQQTMSAKDRKHRLYRLNQFTSGLFRDALARGSCDASDALSAVYLSGMHHALELTAKLRGEQ